MPIEKDVSELNEKFEALLHEARVNEITLRKFQSFELALLDSDSLAGLIETLLYKYRTGFGWDQVTLTLVDPSYDIRRFLEQSSINIKDYKDLIFLQDETLLNNVYNGSEIPLLTPYSDDTHAFLFSSSTERPGSIGLLPLMRNRQLIGSFNVGSFKKDRFHEDAATDFLEHLAAIISACIETSLAKERLKHLGLIDNLTGVNNRRFFDQRLLEEAARSKRNLASLSCLFIDIDHFKKINDTYGHQAGDEVLKYIARIIREQVRTIDIVARFGGEEFTVLLLDSETDMATEIAERIRSKIAHKPFETPDKDSINLTASLGISTLRPEQCEEPLDTVTKEFVESADKALYIAKNSGRNRVISFTEE